MKGVARRWLIGLVFGAVVLLVSSTVSGLILRWYRPYLAETYPLTSPFLPFATYAVLVTLSLEPQVLTGYLPASISRMVAVLVSGGVAAALFQTIGVRRGAAVFLVILAVTTLFVALFNAAMIAG